MDKKKRSKGVDDEYYERASKHRQWNERRYQNIDEWEMKKEEIIELKSTLAHSWGVNSEEVTHKLELIENEEDEDRDEYMNCVFYIKTYNPSRYPDGKKVIFSIKVKIPEHMLDSLREKRMRDLLKNVQQT